MIEVLSRSFGVTDLRERLLARDQEAGTAERSNVRPSTERGSEKDIFDLARGIAFRARARRVRPSRII